MDTTTTSVRRALSQRPVMRVFASARHSLSQSGAIWPWLVLALTLAGFLPFELLLPTGRWAKVVRGMTTAALCTAVLGAWVVFVLNVLQQNHPQWARLVPNHVATLRRALYLGAAIVTVYAATLAAWAGWSAPVAALIVASSCAFAAFALRWPLLWLLPLVALGTWQWQVKAGVPRTLGLLWQEVPWALAATVLAASGLALRAAVRVGGADHARAQIKLAATAATARGETPTVIHRGFNAGWFGPTRWSAWAYNTWMRCLLSRPGSSPGARLALGVGAQGHWSGALAFTLYLVLLVAILTALHTVVPLGSFPDMLLLPLGLAGLMVPLQVPVALWATRHEQALLTLLPGAPVGAALNRWLALRLAAIDGAVLLSLMAVVALFSRIGGADPGRTGDIVLGALVLGLLITPLLWRDWARARAPSGPQHWALIGTTVMIGITAGVWVSGYERSWHELIGWTLLVGLPLAGWRWRRLQQLPAAWPVGRIV